MEITLEDICKGISDALKKEGHFGVLYAIEGNIAKIVSANITYEITQKEEGSRTVFELSCKNRTISDAVYDYFDHLSGYNSMNFPSGAKTIIIGIEKAEAPDEAQLRTETSS